MNERQKELAALVDRHEEMILEAEKYLWAHPQTGYREWEAHEYLTAAYEKLGYTLHPAGNIPGFYTDLYTGKPGPTFLVLGELDALLCESHPDARNGVAHACGHCCQSASLLGFAAALKEPGALEGLCGTVRLMAVPAEELIELGYREELRKQGIIRYYGGKVEFMARGFFDGVDMACMLHTTSSDSADFLANKGQNGCLTKKITYQGKAAHAGGTPHLGVNALYAAQLGMNAVNALRETFRDEDHIRFHPIVTSGGSAVNVIPAETVLESYVRGASLEAIRSANFRVNRALAGAALSMGAKVELSDRPGYSPLNNDPTMMEIAEQCMVDLAGADRVDVSYTRWASGCTDMGDVSCVMPAIQPLCAGSSGIAHAADYFIRDPRKACCNAAKLYLLLTHALLGNEAAGAKKVLANHKPLYPSIRDYLAAVDSLFLDKQAVEYREDGSAEVAVK